MDSLLLSFLDISVTLYMYIYNRELQIDWLVLRHINPCWDIQCPSQIFLKELYGFK